MRANGSLSLLASWSRDSSEQMYSRKTFDDQESNVCVRGDASVSTLKMVLRQVDSTADQLTEVTSHDPEGKILATSTRRSKTHDGSRFSNIPASRANTRDEATEDDILLDVSAVFQGDQDWY